MSPNELFQQMGDDWHWWFIKNRIRENWQEWKLAALNLALRTDGSFPAGPHKTVFLFVHWSLIGPPQPCVAIRFCSSRIASSDCCFGSLWTHLRASGWWTGDRYSAGDEIPGKLTVAGFNVSGSLCTWGSDQDELCGPKKHQKWFTTGRTGAMVRSDRCCLYAGSPSHPWVGITKSVQKVRRPPCCCVTACHKIVPWCGMTDCSPCSVCGVKTVLPWSFFFRAVADPGEKAFSLPWKTPRNTHSLVSVPKNIPSPCQNLQLQGPRDRAIFIKCSIQPWHKTVMLQK